MQYNVPKLHQGHTLNKECSPVAYHIISSISRTIGETGVYIASIRQNQIIFKIGNSPLIMKLLKHTHTHIYILAAQ